MRENGASVCKCQVGFAADDCSELVCQGEPMCTDHGEFQKQDNQPNPKVHQKLENQSNPKVHQKLDYQSSHKVHQKLDNHSSYKENQKLDNQSSPNDIVHVF